MIAQGLRPPVLVFVASKERAKQLHTELKLEHVHSDYISADQSQAARAAAVDAFRAGRTWMLIATDLVGRGMDFLGVHSVINYDFPGNRTDYIHRRVRHVLPGSVPSASGTCGAHCMCKPALLAGCMLMFVPMQCCCKCLLTVACTLATSSQTFRSRAIIVCARITKSRVWRCLVSPAVTSGPCSQPLA
jgi:hypothetical protein